MNSMLSSLYKSFFLFSPDTRNNLSGHTAQVLDILLFNLPSNWWKLCSSQILSVKEKNQKDLKTILTSLPFSIDIYVRITKYETGFYVTLCQRSWIRRGCYSQVPTSCMVSWKVIIGSSFEKSWKLHSWQIIFLSKVGCITNLK